MKVGIPRALLFYKYEKFWTTFFSEVGIEYIISPETNQQIINDAANLAIDETCLPTKILLGHINWLKDKCDYVFIPRVEFVYRYQMCTKFMAQTDLAINTFRGENIKFLFYNVDHNRVKMEYKAIKKMGKFLGLKRSVIKYAYFTAKQAQLYYEMFRSQNQLQLLQQPTTKNKVLVVAHAYNIGDKYVGEPILRQLKALGCEPIIAEYFDARECIQASTQLSKTLPWAYNKHLLGALALYRNQVDGIVIMTTFPCGPDSMVNEMIIRKIKDKPILTLTIDTQDGSAGLETRLESFVDILNFQKERPHA